MLIRDDHQLPTFNIDCNLTNTQTAFIITKDMLRVNMYQVHNSQILANDWLIAFN